MSVMHLDYWLLYDPDYTYLEKGGLLAAFS